MITFKEAYNRIVNAYMNDKLNPFHPCACFVGNLLSNNSDWTLYRVFRHHGESFSAPNTSRYYHKNCGGGYTIEEITDLENMFMKTLSYSETTVISEDCNDCSVHYTYHEDNLFHAMEATLLLLKEIHEKRGEVVESFEFKQRRNDNKVQELQTDTCLS